MTHTYHPYPYNREGDCAECGMGELDHYWQCEEHKMIGNGPYNCSMCPVRNPEPKHAVC